MKKNIQHLSKWLIISICIFFANQAKASNSNDTAVKTETFTVTEMGCATDSKMVEKALYRKKGVKKVQLGDGEITIKYNSTLVKREDLIQAIENTGTCEDPNAKVHKVKLKQ